MWGWVAGMSLIKPWISANCPAEREKCESYFTSRYANAALLSVNVSKEVLVTIEKWKRNKIVGGLSGRAAETVQLLRLWFKRKHSDPRKNTTVIYTENALQGSFDLLLMTCHYGTTQIVSTLSHHVDASRFKGSLYPNHRTHFLVNATCYKMQASADIRRFCSVQAADA